MAGKTNSEKLAEADPLTLPDFHNAIIDWNIPRAEANNPAFRIEVYHDKDFNILARIWNNNSNNRGNNSNNRPFSPSTINPFLTTNPLSNTNPFYILDPDNPPKPTDAPYSLPDNNRNIQKNIVIIADCKDGPNEPDIKLLDDTLPPHTYKFSTDSPAPVINPPRNNNIYADADDYRWQNGTAI
eukprot:189089_1